MKIEIKGSLAEVNGIKDLLNRANIVLGRKSFKEMLPAKKNEIYSFSFNIVTKVATIEINEEYITDCVDIYGDAFIASLMFAKSMASVSIKCNKINDKWQKRILPKYTKEEEVI
jgi:hypothetical protein